MRRIRATLTVTSLTLAAAIGICAGARSNEPASSQALQLISFSADAVDGVDELVVKGREHRIEHQEWQPITNAHVTIHAPLPRDETLRCVVRNATGRPAVSVVQQPTAANDYELRIRIDDGPEAGAAPLSFEVFAVKAPQRPRLKHPYNVVIVTIDSLRPDRLGCYGCPRPTSPNIDKFARGATRFTNAFSSSSFTPPSHASLFTSRYVGDPGLLTWNRLPDEQLTLAEVLNDSGYRTFASVNLELLSSQNLGQGFQTRIEGSRDGRRVIDDGLIALRQPSNSPLFLWLHVYDVHRPYGGPASWARRFNEGGRAGVGNGEEHYNLLPKQIAQRRLSEGDLAFIADRYDAGIAYIDSQIEPLLDELSSPQRLRDTLVVLTADHGESLREHRERLFTHDPFLFASVTRIPLVIRFPEGRAGGAAREEMASLIDIAPSVLDAIGLARPKSFQGLSLLPLLDGRPLARSAVFMECWGWEERSAIRTPRWSAIHDRKTKTTEFFDLQADPTEQQPLSAAPAAAKELEQSLHEFVDRARNRRAPTLDARTRERLRSLGYVGPD